MADGAPLKVTFGPPFASRMGMRVELSDDVSSLEFSPDLAGILGFDAGVKYSGHEPIWGQRAVDMYGSLGFFYVYCDLAEYIDGLVYNYGNSLSVNFTGDAKNVIKIPNIGYC